MLESAVRNRYIEVVQGHVGVYLQLNKGTIGMGNKKVATRADLVAKEVVGVAWAAANDAH